MCVGKAIKVAMAKKEIDQQELSRISGVSQSSISLIVNKKIKPQIKTVNKIAKSMGFSYEEFMGLGE